MTAIIVPVLNDKTESVFAKHNGTIIRDPAFIAEAQALLPEVN